MISDELKQVIDQIKDQGKMRFLEAATEEQIALFEKENDIKLPAQYKEWLQYSDGGELYLPAGVQLYGVAHKPLIDKDDNDRVKLRNVAAREVAEKYSISVIDLYDITSVNVDKLSDDGIHPTEPLYEKIADEIIRNIR